MMIDPRVQWNTTDALIAASCGGIVGFVAPGIAIFPKGTSILMSLGLYGAMNIVQYSTTELVHGRKPTKRGIAWAAITGIAAGSFAGLDKTLRNFKVTPPEIFVVNAKDTFKTMDELYKITIRNQLAKCAWKNVLSYGTIRSFLSSVASNTTDFSKEFLKFMKERWKEITGKEWSPNYAF